MSPARWRSAGTAKGGSEEQKKTDFKDKLKRAAQKALKSAAARSPPPATVPEGESVDSGEATARALGISMVSAVDDHGGGEPVGGTVRSRCASEIGCFVHPVGASEPQSQGGAAGRAPVATPPPPPSLFSSETFRLDSNSLRAAALSAVRSAQLTSYSRAAADVAAQEEADHSDATGGSPGLQAKAARAEVAHARQSSAREQSRPSSSSSQEWSSQDESYQQSRTQPPITPASRVGRKTPSKVLEVPMVQLLYSSPEKAEKEGAEKVEKAEQLEKTEKIEKIVKVEKIEKVEKVEKIEKVEPTPDETAAHTDKASIAAEDAEDALQRLIREWRP